MCDKLCSVTTTCLSYFGLIISSISPNCYTNPSRVLYCSPFHIQRTVHRDVFL